jgi:hypothetical protein
MGPVQDVESTRTAKPRVASVRRCGDRSGRKYADGEHANTQTLRGPTRPAADKKEEAKKKE